jgi:hypothetical protein
MIKAIDGKLILTVTLFAQSHAINIVLSPKSRYFLG